MTGFDSRRGTRGSRQPKGRLMVWGNAFMAGRVRKGKNPMKFNILILTTTGRKSGVERAVPVGWFPDGNGNWLIVASANGATDNPAWYYNLAAAPAKASIEVDGAQIPVTARQLHDAERAAAWSSITTAAPRFAQYEAKTDRDIPVILLTRRASDLSAAQAGAGWWVAGRAVNQAEDAEVELGEVERLYTAHDMWPAAFG